MITFFIVFMDGKFEFKKKDSFMDMKRIFNFEFSFLYLFLFGFPFLFIIKNKIIFQKI